MLIFIILIPFIIPNLIIYLATLALTSIHDHEPPFPYLLGFPFGSARGARSENYDLLIHAYDHADFCYSDSVCI